MDLTGAALSLTVSRIGQSTRPSGGAVAVPVAGKL
jgi:hypothetical protein